MVVKSAAQQASVSLLPMKNRYIGLKRNKSKKVPPDL